MDTIIHYTGWIASLISIGASISPMLGRAIKVGFETGNAWLRRCARRIAEKPDE